MVQLANKALGIIFPMAAMISIMDLPLYILNTSIFSQQYLALLWGLVAAMIFLNSSQKAPLAKGIHLLLGVCAVLVGGYVAAFYPEMLVRLGNPKTFHVLVSVIGVLLALECTRRVAGWPIVIIALVFLGYGKFGYLVPGLLQIKEIYWARLFSQLFMGATFMFGTPLEVALLIVFSFVLFGQVLFRTGGGDFFIKLANCLMGKYRGGPAKVAILASTLFGTISGSAVANVASTGMVTIPMMKRTGFSPASAGAIETTASTGGIIMPPVMGAGAFVMAEFLEVSYGVVVAAALVPALLYYFGTFMQVDLKAARTGLKGLPLKEVPKLAETLREGWMFFIPLLLLVILLFGFYMGPADAALWGTVAIVGVTSTRKKTRATWWGWRQIGDIFRMTTRSMLEITSICATAGLIVGIVGYTGLGLSLSRVLVEVAGESLILLAILTALTSTILGMGMPPTAAYILLAVLAAPAMVTIGVTPLLAHLFIFYFGALSMITPPVCLAAYTAAPIAGARPMLIAWEAMKLAVAAYLVPFVFLYDPGVALIGSGWRIALSVCTATLAIFAFSVAFERYLFRHLSRIEVWLFLAVAITLIVPHFASRGFGLFIFLVLISLQIRAILKTKPKLDPLLHTIKH